MPSGNELISLRDFCQDPANHAPRSAPPAALDHVVAPDTVAPSVFDPETGRVRVMSGKCGTCGTCIGRHGNLVGLSDERRRDLLGQRPDGSYDEGWTVCHSTLPGNPAGLPPSVCAWIAQHPQAAARSLAMRIGVSQGFDCTDPQPTL